MHSIVLLCSLLYHIVNLLLGGYNTMPCISLSTLCTTIYHKFKLCGNNSSETQFMAMPKLTFINFMLITGNNQVFHLPADAAQLFLYLAYCKSCLR